MVFLRHIGQFIGHTHGHEDRHTRADANDLNVFDLAQPAEQLFQQLGRQGQRVTARKQHVAYLRGAFKVLDLGFKISSREGLGGVAHNTGTGAVPAVRGALRGHQHQHTVRVAVYQARHRGVAVFVQGIFHHACKDIDLACSGDDLLANGVIRIVGVNE
ncbi:hypothetical protein SDC9_129407 [bioreactor metagenome]|uniref:Uncharacterized protein n=1 Tax=bioreactor metagenome TaxID=1076179 RepID=A0A645CYW6_9ZZZZ